MYKNPEHLVGVNPGVSCSRNKHFQPIETVVYFRTLNKILILHNDWYALFSTLSDSVKSKDKNKYIVCTYRVENSFK